MASYSFEADFQDVQKGTPEVPNGLKACLFNLIVISYDLERALYCQELVRIITERFPCRIIFVRAEPDTQYDHIRETTSVQYVGSESSKIICDMISIEAGLNQIKQVPFHILPNIVPDLPVYVILAHDPTQDLALLHDVQPLASRIIFGTPHVDNMQRFAKSIREMIETNHKQYIDIHWARSKGWREVFAKVFTDVEKLDALKTATNINVVFTAPPSTSINRYELQALYFQAWLASRLQWELSSVEGPRSTPQITYKTATGSVKVSLGVQDSEILDRGALWSVEIMGGDDHHFLINHERDSKHVKVHSSGPDRCDMPYTVFMSNYQRGSALISELFYQPPSEHYLAMLKEFDSEMWNLHSK